jgi:modification methylase EcoRI
MANKTLTLAKKAKNDEFYTQLGDIEREMRHYKQHFKGKTVLCNCDDPRVSNFFKYFALNFELLGLKRLIATCYKSKEINTFSQNNSEQAVYIVYEGDKNDNHIVDNEEIEVKPLKGDGDFRSKECIELLKQADIVVTNPPFSLFREYITQLIEYDKSFIVIGNYNAITYKEIFPLIKNNKLWLGNGFSGGNAYFNIIPTRRTFANGVYDESTQLVKFRNCCWYTNLDIKKRHEELILYKCYSPEEYPKYDNYDAINVNKVKEIPVDYDGVMGVPITFMDKYNPKQFEIIGQMANTNIDEYNFGYPFVRKERKYARILIRHTNIFKHK